MNYFKSVFGNTPQNDQSDQNDKSDHSEESDNEQGNSVNLQAEKKPVRRMSRSRRQVYRSYMPYDDYDSMNNNAESLKNELEKFKNLFQIVKKIYNLPSVEKYNTKKCRPAAMYVPKCGGYGTQSTEVVLSKLFNIYQNLDDPDNQFVKQLVENKLDSLVIEFKYKYGQYCTIPKNGYYRSALDNNHNKDDTSNSYDQCGSIVLELFNILENETKNDPQWYLSYKVNELELEMSELLEYPVNNNLKKEDLPSNYVKFYALLVNNKNETKNKLVNSYDMQDPMFKCLNDPDYQEDLYDFNLKSCYNQLMLMNFLKKHSIVLNDHVSYTEISKNLSDIKESENGKIFKSKRRNVFNFSNNNGEFLKTLNSNQFIRSNLGYCMISNCDALSNLKVVTNLPSNTNVIVSLQTTQIFNQNVSKFKKNESNSLFTNMNVFESDVSCMVNESMIFVVEVDVPQNLDVSAGYFVWLEYDAYYFQQEIKELFNTYIGKGFSSLPVLLTNNKLLFDNSYCASSLPYGAVMNSSSFMSASYGYGGSKNVYGIAEEIKNTEKLFDSFYN